MIKLKLLPKKYLIRRSIREDCCANVYYNSFVGWYYRKRLKMIKDLIESIYDKKFNRILEVGYGTGAFLPTLADLSHRVFGIDIHEYHNTIKNMITHYGLSNVELFKCDVRNLEFDNNFFDCIVCVSVLEHILNFDKAINEILRVLKPNGYTIIGLPVENSFTFFIQSVFGVNAKTFHVSNYQDIITHLNKKTKIEKTLIFPKIFPLYIAICVRK